MNCSNDSAFSLDDLKLSTLKFTKREEIKPWLQSTLLNKKGIHLVIARSDANKIIFQCKSTRRDLDVSTYEKPRINGRQRTCPFKIRANYSVRNKVWSLVIINDMHDHELDTFHSLFRGDSSSAESHMHEIPASRGTGSLKVEPSPETAPSGSERIFCTPDSTSLFLEKKLKGFSAQSGSDEELKFHNNAFNETTAESLRQETSQRLNGSSSSHPRKLRGDTYISMLKERKDLYILFEEINKVIQNKVMKNNAYSADDKSVILDYLISRIANEYKSLVGEKLISLKSKHGIYQTSVDSTTNTSTSNLIPLTPLLNDVNSEYRNDSFQNPSESSPVENIAQFPMNMSNILSNNSSTQLSSGDLLAAHNTLGLQSVHSSSYMVPSQMQLSLFQINNQQLPSFNTIQNQLTLSPNSLQATSSSMTANYNLGASANLSVRPINILNEQNRISNSAIGSRSKRSKLPSSSKLSNSMLGLGDLKISLTFPITSQSPFQISSNGNPNSSLNYLSAPNHASNLAGVSSPTNNIIHQNGQMPVSINPYSSSNISKDNLNNYSNQRGPTSTYNILNGLNSLNSPNDW